MAAGLGFKTFTTGEVLTAADTNGYLMQGINVFASTAARDAAITSPQEGQFAYTKDTNSLWYYTGSAWAASGATGDIEGVTAGVGITGGGTSGTVTITNDMATTITAAGDIVVGTGSGTYDNLPIGTTAQVLTADTTVSPYKVKWATPASSGGMTLLATTTLTGGSVTVTGLSTYKELWFVIRNARVASNSYMEFRLNGDSGTNYTMNFIKVAVSAITSTGGGTGTSTGFGGFIGDSATTTNLCGGIIRVSAADQTSGVSYTTNTGFNDGTGNTATWANGRYFNTAVISSIQLYAGASTFSAGTLMTYGVN
jgi:hypothetical protein